MEDKKIKSSINYFGKQPTEAALIFLELAEDNDLGKLRNKIKKGLDNYIKAGRQEVADKAKENKIAQDKLKKNKLENYYLSDEGMAYKKNPNKICPLCDGVIWGCAYCGKIKEEHPNLKSDGEIICENNFILKDHTGGTGECEYAPELPYSILPHGVEHDDDCVGCPEKDKGALK